MSCTKTVGLLGLGEVGSSFSRGLLDNGIGQVFVFDVRKFHPEEGQIIQERAKQIGVTLVNTAQELIEQSDIALAATTAAAAIETAQGVMPFLSTGKIYVDLNSASPNCKKKINEIVTSKGASFVDGAIMGAISLQGHRSPILLSGTRAEEVKEFLSGFGMQLRVVDDKPGTASSLKMLRSVFAKGLEAVLLESMVAAYAYQVDDLLFSSICELMDKNSFREFGNMLLTTNAIHSLRRAQEMDGVIETLGEGKIDDTMSQSSRQKLQWSTDLGLREHFHGEIPQDYRAVLEVIAEKTK